MHDPTACARELREWLFGLSRTALRGTMGEPYTIRIFVPDGDPEGLRIIDRMNWTGLGIVFPRESWSKIRQRLDFGKPGVYILVGYVSEEDDLPTLYIGQ